MCARPSNRSQHGFSLLELMITVAIISILAAVVYPSYMDSVRKARRAEAKAALTRMMQVEERFYTANNVYIDSGDTRFTAANGFKTFSGDNPSNSAYTISAALSTSACGTTTASDQCVILSATAVQTDPKCQFMTVNNVGIKTSSPSTTDCW